MNNKGFTIIELLATIILLSLVMGIATYSVIGIINSSKEKSEKIFVDKLATAIQSYIPTKKLGIINTLPDFTKCRENDPEKCKNQYLLTNVKLVELDTIELNKIAIEGNKIINSNEIINPRTKEKCIKTYGNKTLPQIRIFRDSDYVYYYYMDLSGNNTACNITEENSIVTNIPRNVCQSICSTCGYNSEKGICKLS